MVRCSPLAVSDILRAAEVHVIEHHVCGVLLTKASAAG